MPADHEIAGEDSRDELKRELTRVDSIFLVVACVIGAGIFFTPGRVAELLPSPYWILAAWVFGGLISWAGAVANAELGTMFPRAGGDYVYLREGVHPLAGFLVGWLSFIVIYAGTIAALAAALAEGICDWLGWTTAGVVPLAVGVTIASTALNIGSVRWGVRANNFTTLFKIVALLAFCLLGPVFGEGDPSRLIDATPVVPDGAGPSLRGFALAMSPVLFSYLGWNASVYVASEIRDPARNIPLSLFAGLGICAGIYLAVNAVYLYALPMTSLAGVANAGQASALALFGPVGGTLVGIFVLGSVLGTLNAAVLIGPRIAYSMALDGLFFGGVDRVSARRKTPVVALVAQCLIVIFLLVVLRSFPSALDFTTFAILLATMADIIALFRLRWSQPDRPRPYRAWGYPWVPMLYFAANLGIAAAILWARPFECLIGLAMLACGLPFYFAFSKVRPARTK